MRSVVRTNTGRKGKKRRVQGNGDGQVERRIQQSKRNDPLMGGSSSSSSGSNSGSNGGNNSGSNDNNDNNSEPQNTNSNEKIDRVFTSGEMAHGLGKTSNNSGRQQWKMRHSKGKFDTKKNNKESHRMTGAFVKSKQYK